MGCFWPQTFCLAGEGVGEVFNAFPRVLYCNIMATLLYGPLHRLHAAELARLNLEAESMARSAGVAVKVLCVPFRKMA